MKNEDRIIKLQNGTDTEKLAAAEILSLQNRITELNTDVEQLKLDKDKGAVDYCQLLDKNDALFVQNSEFKANIEKVRIFLLHIKKCLVKNGEYAPVVHWDIDKLIASTPKQCLVELISNAGREGFIAGFKSSNEGHNFEYGCNEKQLNEMADIYINKILNQNN